MICFGIIERSYRSARTSSTDFSLWGSVNGSWFSRVSQDHSETHRLKSVLLKEKATQSLRVASSIETKSDLFVVVRVVVGFVDERIRLVDTSLGKIRFHHRLLSGNQSYIGLKSLVTGQFHLDS